MIFRFIKAREKWLLDLIWRKRLEHKDDIAEKKVKNSENEKNLDLNKENPLFTKWCKERKDRFNAIDIPAEEDRLEGLTQGPLLREDGFLLRAVSYTHLTLPTIYSV